MGTVRFIRLVATLNTLTIVYLHMQVKKSLRQHVHTPCLCERDIYMPHLVRVIVARSASAFNEPRRISTTKERDKQRSHSTGSHWVSSKKIHQRKQDGIPSPSGACPNHGTCAYTHTHIHAYGIHGRACTYDATVMYKVLRVNDQQTGREPRINERNFGTCGMPADALRFIHDIQTCSFVYASSATNIYAYTVPLFLLRKGEIGEDG